MILGTGMLLTFPTDRSVIPDCFSQGYSILQKMAIYYGPQEKGKDQAWILKGTNIEVGGWYCR